MSNNYSLDRIDPHRYPVKKLIVEELKRADKDLPLRKFSSIYSRERIRIHKCHQLKKMALRDLDEYTANFALLLEVNFLLIKTMAKFWECCEKREYGLSWSWLQDAIDQCEFLLKFIDDADSGYLKTIHHYVTTVEKLYPYNIFASSAMSGVEFECSICKRDPLSPECDHISGELYNGEVAIHIGKKIGSISHVALVPNPKDKRCIIDIPFEKERPEEGPFKRIHFFIQHSKRPLEPFHVEKQIVSIPRSEITSPPGWPCVCESGLPFEDCCANKDTIRVPHYQISFFDDRSSL